MVAIEDHGVTVNPTNLRIEYVGLNRRASRRVHCPACKADLRHGDATSRADSSRRPRE
jgi:hypothetical protein